MRNHDSSLLLVTLCMWLAGIAFAPFVSSARAQDLLVFETSSADHGVADKLAELLEEPFERRAAADAHGPDTTRGCVSQARFELILDNDAHSVRLLRCRDGTVLTRAIDPEAARATPYLAAFVATELLQLARELERVTTQHDRQQEPAVSVPLQPSAAAMPEPATMQTAAPPAQQRTTRAALRLGAEWIALGKPFGGAVRPNIGLGLTIALPVPQLSWLLEMHVAALAHGTRIANGQQQRRLELTRSDAQLRAGLSYAIGAVDLAAWLAARGSLTSLEFSGATQVSSAYVRWGIGLGGEAQVAVTTWLALYVGLGVDYATSRSNFLVGGDPLLQDPRVVLTASAGMLLRAFL